MRALALVALAAGIAACSGDGGGPSLREQAGGTHAWKSIEGEAGTYVAEAKAGITPPARTEAADTREVDAPTRSAVRSDVRYSIVSDEALAGVKRSIDVRLEERVSESTLRDLANSLLREDAGSYERTFISYYLPDMEVGAGAWATTHFDPDLEVKILGLTIEEFDAIAAAGSRDGSREIVGRWLDDRPFVGEAILIYREGGATFGEYSYSDGSSRIAELVETQVVGGLRFSGRDGSAFGDHYLLTASGDLEIRDVEGLIATAKPID